MTSSQPQFDFERGPDFTSLMKQRQAVEHAGMEAAEQQARRNDEMRIENLDEKTAAEYRNKFLGFIFQSFNLINYKSALENVALPLYYQGLKRKERQKIALNYLCLLYTSQRTRDGLLSRMTYSA